MKTSLLCKIICIFIVYCWPTPQTVGRKGEGKEEDIFCDLLEDNCLPKLKKKKSGITDLQMMNNSSYVFSMFTF